MNETKRKVPPGFHGKKGRSGAKPKFITSIKEEIERHPGRAYEMLEAIYNKGKDTLNVICPQCRHSFAVESAGDKDCAFYYIDRILGKAKQSIDQRTMQIDFTIDDYYRLRPLLKQNIESGNNNLPNNSSLLEQTQLTEGSTNAIEQSTK